MSITSTGRHGAPVATTVTDVVDPFDSDATPSSSGGLKGVWPIAGLVAGVASFLYPFIGSKFYEDDVTDQGVNGVYEFIKDTGTGQHIAMDLAFLAVLALGIFAAGFMRFITSRTPAGSNAASVARLGMTSAVTLTVLVAALKAIYRGGLPDHGDSSMYTKEAVTTLDVLVGQLQYTPMWGLTLVMGAVVALAFRHRTLPRWYGLFSGFLLVCTLLMAFVFGLPYFAGLVGPIWLVVSTIVVLRHRNRPVGITV